MADTLVAGRLQVGRALGVADIPGSRGIAITQGEESGGKIVARLEPVPQSKVWLIERIVVQCTSAADTDVKIYAGEESVPNLVEASPAGGNLNVADETQPILIPAGTRIHTVWDNTPDAGSIGTVRFQYVEAEYVYVGVGV